MEHGEACAKSAPNPQTNALDREAGLKELQQGISKKDPQQRNKKRVIKTRKKYEAPTQMVENQTKTPTPQKRIKLGFSRRSTDQKRGKKATCQGCKCLIDYDALCIRYGFFSHRGQNYPQIYQYHGTVACLKKKDVIEWVHGQILDTP